MHEQCSIARRTRSYEWCGFITGRGLMAGRGGMNDRG